MVNNAVDHSEGRVVMVSIERTVITTRLTIIDDGVGIFHKIRSALKLQDEKQAVLELAKGKLTTDPRKHSGEGIFFTSRMFDEYVILSGHVFFSHRVDDEKDWISEGFDHREGTIVSMSILDNSKRTTTQVYDQFIADEDKVDDEARFGFTRTIIPVRLASQESESLVSRSQARRLLARLDKFKDVVLDFAGVNQIGQAFADEVFRVYPEANPKVKIVPIHAGRQVKRMINHVLSAAPTT